MIEIKKLIRLTTVILNIIFLTACGIQGSPNELIKPPKLLEENEKINTIIEQNIPSEAELENIDSSEGLSAVKVLDMNGDDIDEILVFYSLEGSLYVLSLESSQDSYKSVFNIKVEGNYFEELMVEDITANNIKEMIITTSEDGRNNESKNINVYSYSEEQPNIFQTNYEEYVLEDLNSDENMDIIIFKGENDILSADYYSYDRESKKVEFVNEVIIEHFQNLLKPKLVDISKDRKAILVEAGYLSAREESYATFLTVNEEGELINLLEGQGGDSNLPYIYSTEKIESKDVDEDGKIDISQAMYLTGNSSDIDYFSLDDYIKYISWYGWEGEELAVIFREIRIDNNIRIRVPQNWELLNIVGSENEFRDRTQYSISISRDNQVEENILTINKAESEDLREGFTQFAEIEGTIYSYRLNSDLSDEFSEYRMQDEQFNELVEIEEGEI